MSVSRRRQLGKIIIYHRVASELGTVGFHCSHQSIQSYLLQGKKADSATRLSSAPLIPLCALACALSMP